MNELKGRKEAIKDHKLIKREALTDGTIETLLDGKIRFIINILTYFGSNVSIWLRLKNLPCFSCDE